MRCRGLRIERGDGRDRQFVFQRRLGAGIVDIFGEGAFGPSAKLDEIFFANEFSGAAKDGMLGDLIHEGHENGVDDIYDTCSHQGAEIGMDI